MKKIMFLFDNHCDYCHNIHVPVPDLIKSWDNKPIVSCVLGISKKGMTTNLSFHCIRHAALFLMKKEIYYADDESEMNERTGILIEYGDYSPDMNENEKSDTKNGYVIYPYGIEED